MTKLTPAETEKALSLPLGAMSPLWFLFAGAATAGAAYFWARTWFKPTNLEAMAGGLPVLAAETVAPVIDATETVVETTLELIEETVEAAPEIVETAVEVAETVPEAIEAAAEPVVEAIVEAVEAAADDLTRLSGIGPKLAQSLAERGVTRFADIAAWTAEDIARFDKDMKLMGRVEREAWVAQAQRFAEAAVH